ncbi:hypothetical protein BGZ65_005575 [Modicella reniformis]|uniref:Uncharacterized protein n=1 Tax=Modicella reniformis TaxID=1440133 RepID=A0A9P6JNU2_9FUNG|nr:hypothetical protein BGZ65_005575 [Modicella reniformis]
MNKENLFFFAATLIDRENKRVVQGAIAQISHKVHQVREALQRQSHAIEETQSKLELLFSRLAQMEQQNRARGMKRNRQLQQDIQRLEDERWMREWDKE